MNNDLISREAVIEDFRSCGANSATVEAIVCRIKLQPAVDAVEVVHSKWEEKSWWQKKNGKANCYVVLECSVCGCQVKPRYTYNYCPNCGARMDGEQ